MTNTHKTNDYRVIETINVAISANTILYTPFFLAYYGEDFKNTPFGSFSVNIIGKKEDSRFNEQANLKGDGFATFCLLLGLADISICDPSYLVCLQSESNQLEREFSLFEKLLEPQAKHSLQEKHNKFLSYDASNNTLTISDEETFKEIFDDKKIIGGLISKIAFSVACAASMEDKPGFDALDKLGRSYKKRAETKTFIEDNISGKFIYYNSPSTGFCIGDIFSKIYEKNITNKTVNKDFGQELKTLQEENHKNSIAFSCDYVSLDYLIDKKTSILELDDLATDSKSYLFTGILGNCDSRKKLKLQGLLYAIDKNLFQISQFLKDGDTTGLTKYFRQKFSYTKAKEQELINLLVADNDCRNNIKKDIDTDEDFTFDTILGYYVNRLYRWKPKGKGLYYNKTTPNLNHLKNILELRKESFQLSISTDENDLSTFIEVDLLHEWRLKESIYFKYEEKANSLRLENENKHFLYKTLINLLLIIASPIIMIPSYFLTGICRIIPQYCWRQKLREWLQTQIKWPFKLVDTLKTTIWTFTSNPSYLYSVGSAFLIFELASSISHVFNQHFPTIKGELPVLSSLNIQNYGFDKWFDIPVSLMIYIYIYIYLLLAVVTLISLSRKHIELRESNKYVYRNEQ